MQTRLIAIMSSNEINDKTRVVELANAIRQKFNKFRHGEADYKLQMERKYKPLIKLQKNEHLKQESGASSEKVGTITDLITCEDTIFGVKHNEDGSYSLGSHPVEFVDNKIKVLNVEYNATRGLISLLTRKNPQNYSTQDVQAYKQMLIATSAHLRKTDNKIKSCRGVKTKFIRNLFQNDDGRSNDKSPEATNDFVNTSQSQAYSDISNANRNLVTRLLTKRPQTNLFATSSPTSTSTPQKPPSSIFSSNDEEAASSAPQNLETGEGLQMKLIKADDHVKKLYTYWDDPNELVDRLCLLHASKEAGNNNVSNEIISIVSELRQAGYIF